jgi:hypothetical protein
MAVLDHAHLKRLAMQVELNMEVDKKMPQWLRKKLMVKGEKVFSNENKKWDIFLKIFYDDFNLIRIARNFVIKKLEERID